MKVLFFNADGSPGPMVSGGQETVDLNIFAFSGDGTPIDTGGGPTIPTYPHHRVLDGTAWDGIGPAGPFPTLAEFDAA